MGSSRCLAVLFALVAVAGVATAIECYHCINFELPESAQNKIPNLHVNGYCKDFYSSAKSVTTQQCAGETDVCQTIKGMYKYDNPTVGQMDAQVQVRRCIKNSEKFPPMGGCIPSKNADPDAHRLNMFPGGSMGDLLKFEGEICTCKDNQCNGASQIGMSVMTVALIAVITKILMA